MITEINKINKAFLDQGIYMIRTSNGTQLGGELTKVKVVLRGDSDYKKILSLAEVTTELGRVLNETGYYVVPERLTSESDTDQYLFSEAWLYKRSAIEQVSTKASKYNEAFSKDYWVSQGEEEAIEYKECMTDWQTAHNLVHGDLETLCSVFPRTHWDRIEAMSSLMGNVDQLLKRIDAGMSKSSLFSDEQLPINVLYNA